MENSVLEYTAGFTVFLFFCGVFLVFFNSMVLMYKVVKEGWWHSSLIPIFRSTLIFGLLTTVLFSVMVLGNPGHDASYLAMVLLWFVLALVYAIFKMYCHRMEEAKWII